MICFSFVYLYCWNKSLWFVDLINFSHESNTSVWFLRFDWNLSIYVFATNIHKFGIGSCMGTILVHYWCTWYWNRFDIAIVSMPLYHVSAWYWYTSIWVGMAYDASNNARETKGLFACYTSYVRFDFFEARF